MMTSFLTPFLRSNKNADQNIAESDHQRNFCKKPHVKSFFGSEGDSGRSYRHTHTHTHRHGLTINYIGIGMSSIEFSDRILLNTETYTMQAIDNFLKYLSATQFLSQSM